MSDDLLDTLQMGRADRAQFSTATGDADAAGQRRTVMKRRLYDDERFVLISIGGLVIVTSAFLLLAAFSARSPKLVLNRADWTCTETVSETHYYTQYIEAGEVDIPVIQPVTSTECVNYRRTGGDK